MSYLRLALVTLLVNILFFVFIGYVAGGFSKPYKLPDFHTQPTTPTSAPAKDSVEYVLLPSLKKDALSFTCSRYDL
jgi:hypothetical protein